MDKLLYPNHPVRCIITGPSNVGKSVFLTNLILNFINEYKKNIYLLTKSSSRFISKINQKFQKLHTNTHNPR